MRRALQSTVATGLLLLLLIVSIVNTCQLDNLERRLQITQRAVEELARAKGAAMTSETIAATAATRDVVLAAALADPRNLLRPPTRSLAAPRSVVRGGTLRRKIGQDPAGLNPYVAAGGDVVELTTYINCALAERDRRNPDVFTPGLAIKVVTEDGGLTYAVTLRQGVRWHRPIVPWESGRFDWLEGEHEVTSDDFAFVFDILREPKVRGRVSSLRNYFEALDEVTITGRYTFEVRFRERLYTNLPALLDLTPMPRWLYMADQHGERYAADSWGEELNKHWYNKRGIGTGPYQFVGWEPGIKIELARNPHYFGEQPAFDRVVLYILKDQEAWPRRLQAGELDITELRPQQIRTVMEEAKASGRLLGSEHIRQARHPTAGYTYIGWNAKTPVFQDKRVRQAMTMALNRQDIVKSVYAGFGKVITGPFVQENPCYDRSLEPWPFDLGRAAESLAQAGWVDSDGNGVRDRLVDGERRELAFDLLFYGSSAEYRTLASVYREDLMRIGVRMTPRALAWATLLSRIDQRDFEAAMGAWGVAWDVDLYQLWHSSEAEATGGGNRISFKNPQADLIIEKLRRTFAHDERVRLCHAFHRIVHDEQPYTFLLQRERPVLYWAHLNPPEFSLVWPHRDLRAWSFRVKRP